MNLITNPVLPGDLGSRPAAGLTQLISTLLKFMFILGALIFLFFILTAGINWITAEGKPEKVEKARTQLIDAIIGMVILAGAVALTSFIGAALKIDFLKTLDFSLPTVGGTR